MLLLSSMLSFGPVGPGVMYLLTIWSLIAIPSGEVILVGLALKHRKKRKIDVHGIYRVKRDVHVRKLCKL